MNLVILLVLVSVAWYAFENGMEFFAALLVVGAVLMLFVQKEEKEASEMYVGAPGHGAHGGGPVIIEPQHETLWPEKRGSELYNTQHIRLMVKPKWKKEWLGKPYHYMFFHMGVALSFISRSILYILGIEKDKPREE